MNLILLILFLHQVYMGSSFLKDKSRVTNIEQHQYDINDRKKVSEVKYFMLFMNMIKLMTNA